MQVKLQLYNLGGYYRSSKEIQVGDKVCPANGFTSVGIIVDIKEPAKDSYGGNQYTILWATGNKKGKKLIHDGRNLVSVKHYLAACHLRLDKAEALLAEANQFGV